MVDATVPGAISEGAEVHARSGASRPIGGSEIGRCLTRVHHDRFTPAEMVADPIRERAASKGIAYEDAVLAHLVATHPDAIDLRTGDLQLTRRDTEAAMARGASMILGGRLVSTDGTLVGMPDILIHDGTGYLPIDVKHHKVIGAAGAPVTPAPIDDLLSTHGEPVPFRARRRADLLQVTHYAAILADRGVGSDRSLVGIIGTDEPLMCVWADTADADPDLTLLHRDYVRDAQRVIDHGRAHPGRPLVEAARQQACDTCPWRSLCLPELARRDDPTLLRGVNAGLRDELRAEGIHTITQVADLDLLSALVEPDAILQARAVTAGGLLRADDGSEPLGLTTTPLEVDLDIETYGQLTYLAGLAITTGRSTEYRAIVDWTGETDGERRVLTELFATLADLGARGATVYHWTGFEIMRLSEGAHRHGLTIPGAASVESWFADHAIDLCDWSRRHLVSPNGHSLKTIAPLCGFKWRDDDPGGLQSELWFEAQLDHDLEMRRRILAYNEDDVLAQLAIRRHVRAAWDDIPRAI